MNKGIEWIRKIGVSRFFIMIMIGVLLVVISLDFGGTEKKTVEEEKIKNKEDTMSDYKSRIEKEIQNILSQVSGVGKVSVMVTLKATGEKVTLKDASASGEKSEEETVLVEGENRETAPYVVQEKEPEIEGVVVVCQGGGDVHIQHEISNAISALFSVESHKIKVMKSKEARQ